MVCPCPIGSGVRQRTLIPFSRSQASGGFATLVDPSTEEPVARVSSDGVDFGAALDWAQQALHVDSLHDQLPHWLQQDYAHIPLFINAVGKF